MNVDHGALPTALKCRNQNFSPQYCKISQDAARQLLICRSQASFESRIITLRHLSIKKHKSHSNCRVGLDQTHLEPATSSHTMSSSETKAATTAELYSLEQTVLDHFQKSPDSKFKIAWVKAWEDMKAIAATSDLEYDGERPVMLPLPLPLQGVSFYFTTLKGKEQEEKDFIKAVDTLKITLGLALLNHGADDHIFLPCYAKKLYGGQSML